MRQLGAAVIAAGNWGPNLVRNMAANPRVDLRWVCDLDEERAGTVVAPFGSVRTTSDRDTVLDDPDVDLVVIATPAATHVDLGLAAIGAGKHLLVEKPLASTLADGQKLVHAAHDAGVVLMCDHTYCYTPAVQRIAELIAHGELGDLHYVDSVRINPGLLHHDLDVFWDLAPHDLSILDAVLPAGARPTAVAASGADPGNAGQACVGYMSLPLSNGAIAHTHVNGLSPTKMRRIVIGGSRRMLVWDDLQPSQQVQLFDCGADVTNGAEASTQRLISYRVGDTVAPALPEREALGAVVDELLGAIIEDRPAEPGATPGCACSACSSPPLPVSRRAARSCRWLSRGDLIACPPAGREAEST